MKRKIINGLLVAALVATASGTFVSCKDYEEDDVQQMQYDLNNLDASYQKKVQDLLDKYTALKGKVDGIKSCDCNDDALNALKSAVNTRIDSLKDASAKNLTDSMTNIRSTVNAVNGRIDEYANQLKSVASTTGYALQLAKADSVRLDEALAQAEKALKAAQDAQKTADEANGNAGKAQEAANKAQETADAAKDSAATNSARIQNLKNQLEQQIELSTTRYNTLNNVVTDMFASLITSVEIQGSYCPAVGDLALPLDIQSNMLMTYYGNNSSAFQFPTNDASYFADADQAANISAADVAGDKVTIPAGTLYCNDGAAGNAGKLYVTINPSTVNLTGVNVKLQNSRGEESTVKLGALAKSNDLLTFGWTRAAEDNNFYEIPATINKDNLEDLKVTFNGSGLRNDINTLINERNKTKVTLKQTAKDLAQFVYQNMNGKFPRLALATKMGSYTKADGTQGSFGTNVSSMNIMAAAFKPLGYASLDNLHINNTPGIERLENAIANFINSIKVGKVHIADADNIKTIDKIGQITRNGEDYIVSVTYTVQVYDAATKTTKEEQRTTSVNINDQIDQLLATVNGSLEDFNNNIDAINTLITSLQQGVDVTSVADDVKGQIISKIDTYLDNFNNRFVYWFNRIPSSLHPVLLFTTGDGNVARVTTATSGRPVIGSSVTLIPTSYTLELFAPAYKKFVKCTSSNAGDLKSSKLGKVLPGTGSDTTIDIEGMKVGQTYEFLYETVDYTGKVFARKYYLTREK